MTSGFMSRIGKNATVVDTSAHYALADSKDAFHSIAVEFAKQLRHQGAILIVTNFIIAEVYGLLLLRLGRYVAFNYTSALLDGVSKGAIWLERVTEADERRAWEILRSYADQNFSYVDATTFAVMERLNLTRAFAFDRHFDVFRFKGQRPIIRLPEVSLRFV
ncbi:MAG: PIN domain-containing protein [Armatimonadetes bacterium]|nr:PIN domain-containing protein [Armatimonadota bacterium]MDW8029837.1 PIN domain-containing protein [Armatimonadota bacterium]